VEACELGARRRVTYQFPVRAASTYGQSLARFWASAAKELVLPRKQCRINALDGIASTG
jgi:hypothetical protein